MKAERRKPGGAAVVAAKNTRSLRISSAIGAGTHIDGWMQSRAMEGHDCDRLLRKLKLHTVGSLNESLSAVRVLAYVLTSSPAHSLP